MRLPSLYQFFRHQVQHGFGKHGLAEPETVDYVSDMLTRFAHTRSLYPINDPEGRAVDRIADMLAQSYTSAEWEDRAPDRHRQASLSRHVGEYTLFMSGLFRDRLRTRGELGYYLANGQSAFWRCAKYEINPKRQNVFRRLYSDFTSIADALDHMARFQLRFSSANVTANTLIASLWRV